MANCEGCGTDNPPGEDFCKSCGRVLPSTPAGSRASGGDFASFFGGSPGTRATGTRPRNAAPRQTASRSSAPTGADASAAAGAGMFERMFSAADRRRAPDPTDASPQPLYRRHSATRTTAAPTDAPSSRVAALRHVAEAAIKAGATSLALSAAVLGPGLVLLFNGLTIAGMIWLFVGSFGLMAWTYRKPWRLGWISALMPPLAAMACYAIQLALFGSVMPPFLLIAGAVALGFFLGYLRSQAHVLSRDGNGSVIAERTIGFLVVWVTSYAITQLLGLLAASMFLVRAGLVTGAFTTAALCALSWLLLSRGRRLATAASSLLIAIVLSAGTADRAEAQNSICWISLPGEFILYTGPQVDVPSGTACSNAARSHCDLGGALPNLSIRLDRDPVIATIPPDMDRTPRGSAEGRFVAANPGTRLISRAGLTHAFCREVAARYGHLIGPPQASNDRPSSGTGLGITLPDIDNWLPEMESLLPDLGNSDPPVSISPQDIAAATAAVAAVLIAAGMAINIAQAIAATLAQALQSGVQLTAEEIQNAITEALLGRRPQHGGSTDQRTGQRESGTAPPNVRMTERVRPPRGAEESASTTSTEQEAEKRERARREAEAQREEERREAERQERQPEEDQAALAQRNAQFDRNVALVEEMIAQLPNADTDAVYAGLDALVGKVTSRGGASEEDIAQIVALRNAVAARLEAHNQRVASDWVWIRDRQEAIEPMANFLARTLAESIDPTRGVLAATIFGMAENYDPNQSYGEMAGHGAIGGAFGAFGAMSGSTPGSSALERGRAIGGAAARGGILAATEAAAHDLLAGRDVDPRQVASNAGFGALFAGIGATGEQVGQAFSGSGSTHTGDGPDVAPVVDAPEAPRSGDGPDGGPRSTENSAGAHGVDGPDGVLGGVAAMDGRRGADGSAGAHGTDSADGPRSADGPEARAAPDGQGRPGATDGSEASPRTAESDGAAEPGRAEASDSSQPPDSETPQRDPSRDLPDQELTARATDDDGNIDDPAGMADDPENVETYEGLDRRDDVKGPTDHQRGSVVGETLGKGEQELDEIFAEIGGERGGEPAQRPQSSGELKTLDGADHDQGGWSPEAGRRPEREVAIQLDGGGDQVGNVPLGGGQEDQAITQGSGPVARLPAQVDPAEISTGQITIEIPTDYRPPGFGPRTYEQLTLAEKLRLVERLRNKVLENARAGRLRLELPADE